MARQRKRGTGIQAWMQRGIADKGPVAPSTPNVSYSGQERGSGIGLGIPAALVSANSLSQSAKLDGSRRPPSKVRRANVIASSASTRMPSGLVGGGETRLPALHTRH